MSAYFNSFDYNKSDDPMMTDDEYVFNLYPLLTIQVNRGHYVVNLEEGDPDSDDWGITHIATYNNLIDAQSRVITEWKAIGNTETIHV